MIKKYDKRLCEEECYHLGVIGMKYTNRNLTVKALQNVIYSKAYPILVDSKF